ncbi:unnamed protein product, partial [Sphacelaria rigidula]
MGEVGPGTNGSTDDDMSDLFRSFLVDGEDLLPVGSHPTGSSGHHSGSGGGPPASFGLRVGGGVGVGGHRGGVGHDAEAAATAAMRRRTSASPEMDEMGGGGGGGSQVLRLIDVPFRPISPQSHSQRSPMVMLPALVGSPPRRSDSHNSSNSNNNNNNNNNSNENKNIGGGINAPASRFVPSNHGHGNGGGSSSSSGSGSGSNNSHPHGHSSAKVSAAAVAAAAAAVTAAGAEACPPPASLQLASPWAVDNYSSVSSMTNNVSSSSPAGGAHDIAGGGVPAAPSPAGMSGGCRGIGGGGATIVDFSPTWDFSPGGAKLLICLASPIDVDPGGAGPLVFFADRPVQAEVVSQNVLRCRVPPGPGPDCVGRVTLRVENSQCHNGGGIGRLESPATSHGGSRNDVSNQGILGVHVFEYRAPTNSPSSTPSNVSRGGTP